MDIMNIMDIMDIIDIMDIMIITAWMAMAGAVSALVLFYYGFRKSKFYFLLSLVLFFLGGGKGVLLKKSKFLE